MEINFQYEYVLNKIQNLYNLNKYTKFDIEFIYFNGIYFLNNQEINILLNGVINSLK